MTTKESPIHPQVIRGPFSVKMQPQPFEVVPTSADHLQRFHLDKSYEGELSATGNGQMLAAQTSVKGSAGYVAIELVDGSLCGRKGTFVLLHRGVMNKGEPTLSVSVVPDSGTGDLVGISGDMQILMEDGHEYLFTFELPAVE